MCWFESELYGPATVKQILEGGHVKRAETAHMVTLQALFTLYQEALFQDNSDIHRSLEKLANQLNDAYSNGSKEQVKEAHGKLEEAVESLKIIEKMEEFDARQEKKPLFKVFRHYMIMVMEIMTFVHAVRKGHWALHLEALQAFTKYYFAHDMFNYARMIPVYLAEMAKLKEKDPKIYEEFQQGNWVVNKNSSVSFCAVGEDNALEHVNCSTEVSGGQIGITLNPNARTKYFLIAPELARLTEQAKEMAGTSSKKGKHRDAITSVRTRQERNIEQLVDCINVFTNPFSEESEDLFNLVTKVVMSEKVKIFVSSLL